MKATSKTNEKKKTFLKPATPRVGFHIIYHSGDITGNIYHIFTACSTRCKLLDIHHFFLQQNQMLTFAANARKLTSKLFPID